MHARLGTAISALLLLFATFASAQQIRLSSPIAIADGPLNEYPDLAKDADGTLWITWMSVDGADEVVSLRPFRNGAFGERIEIARGVMADHPRIAIAHDKTIWITWTGQAGGRPQVFARALRGGNAGAPVPVSRDGEAWHPAIAIDHHDNVWIAWEQREGSRWQIVATELGKAPFAVTAANNMQMRPTFAVSGENVWIAWDEYAGDYDYDVMIRCLNRAQRTTRLTGAPALEQSPALAAAADGGVWIAWHSNRADDGSADIPRWIEMRHWDGKQLLQPAAKMPGRDLNAAESMQSFEFPSLLRDSKGRVWLFGRPSQSFYVQVFLGDRWSDLVPFGIEGWGGRGQIVAAVEGDDGAIWTARRDIGQIVLQRMEWVGGAVRPFIGTPASGGSSAGFSRLKQAFQPTKVGGPSGMQLYFGDIHQHSSLSDGMGTVEDAYTRSRDKYHQDFAALTDHEWFVQNRLLPSEWAYIKSVTASFHDPNHFVSIPAYEWTGRRYPLGAGHKNVYFLDESHPIYSIDDPRYDTTPELFTEIKKIGAMAFPHHIGWTGVDWENHDPIAEPDVEMVSVHGAFEYNGNEPITHRAGIPGMFVQDGLARGLRFGLLGSSDGHGLIWHHGIGRKRDPWQQGLTGVWTTSLTREALFEAFKARRIYATSGTRIQLWFEAEGGGKKVPMGGEMTISGAPKLTSQVIGSAKIHYVYLLRDNQVIFTFGPDADGGRYGNFTYDDENAKPGTHWYYVRVVQEDHEMAWSSPIWITIQ